MLCWLNVYNNNNNNHACKRLTSRSLSAWTKTIHISYTTNSAVCHACADRVCLNVCRECSLWEERRPSLCHTKSIDWWHSNAYFMTTCIALLETRLKKNTLSQSLREFFKPMRHAFFYFLFFFYFNWPLPPRTSENQKWLKSLNFRIFRNQTGFYTFFELPRA